MGHEQTHTQTMNNAIEDHERWLREVLTDFRIPFDDHETGRRLALTYWMVEHNFPPAPRDVGANSSPAPHSVINTPTSPAEAGSTPAAPAYLAQLIAAVSRLDVAVDSASEALRIDWWDSEADALIVAYHAVDDALRELEKQQAPAQAKPTVDLAQLAAATLGVKPTPK